MASVIYNSYHADEKRGLINLETNTIKVMLVTSAYTPNIDTHTKRSDITNEVSGTGYTAGGATLASKTVTQNNTTDAGVFDAADVVWTASTITARGAVLYKDTGLASTDNLICYIDFVTDRITTASEFTIQWNASGILATSQA